MAPWQAARSAWQAVRSATSHNNVYVIGVGMTKFEKPGRREDFDYPDMALEAGKRLTGYCVLLNQLSNAFRDYWKPEQMFTLGELYFYGVPHTIDICVTFTQRTKALQDAGISYEEIEQAVVGYVYGDSTCGQRAVYNLGLTGIPVYNVNNNCSTGSTALMIAKQLIEGGLADCVLALGFEKMARGSLQAAFSDRTNPLERHLTTMVELKGMEPAPVTLQLFGNAGREHMEKYGTTKEHFAKIAWKNHKHSVNNPYSQFQTEYSMDEIVSAKELYSPLTKLQCCPTSDGGAAAIVASERFVQNHNLTSQAVKIMGMEMTTDLPSTFKDASSIKLVGYDMTKTAADNLYKKTGICPQDIDVIELHDCFSTNELITYEALGLCEPGKAGELVDRGDNTYGGKYVVNPSGGLISKGHPLGATGLAQCSELCWQLRGMAGKRQVPHAKLALQHNIGLGGASVVAAYQLGFPSAAHHRGSLRVSNVSTPTEKDFQSYQVFKIIRQQLKENGPALVKKLNAVYSFVITDGPAGAVGKWLVDLKTGLGEVIYQSDIKAECTLKISDVDFPLFMSGKLNPQQAFMSGKLKIEGNLGLAMRLGNLKSLIPSAKL